VWSGAPRTYTDVSNYTDGRMILDVVETRTNKLVFCGTGTAVRPEKKDSRCSEAALPRAERLTADPRALWM
jgi:hypothetical protein